MKMPDRLRLPEFLHRYVESSLQRMVFPADASAADFARPSGEPALFDADSLSWRVFKNPLALYIGGVAAVLLELGHPKVRSGIWEHSRFRRCPLERLRRTGYAALMTVYGPATAAQSLIARVNAMHDCIAGVTAEGERYQASDPALLRWVHATASYGFLHAYHRYVEALPLAERDRFYRESLVSATQYRAVGVPASEREMVALMERMADALQPSVVLGEFLDIMCATPVLPAPFALLQPMLARAAIDLLPTPIRARLGLENQWNLSRWQAATVKSAGILANCLILQTAPPVQSCRRLGLPDDHLYRRRSQTT